MDLIDNNYVYFTIPVKYKCIYDKILAKMANLGIDLVKDCNSICDNSNKHLITCWNMFQAACSAYNLNQIKTADFIINYINEQLNLECSLIINNMIFVGHTDLDPNIFKNMPIGSIMKLNTTEYEITDDNLNVQFNQTNYIHFVAVPIEYITLEDASYGSPLSTILWNGIPEESAYNLIEGIYDNKKYTIYFYYSPNGAFDEPINLTFKIN